MFADAYKEYLRHILDKYKRSKLLVAFGMIRTPLFLLEKQLVKDLQSEYGNRIAFVELPEDDPKCATVASHPGLADSQRSAEVLTKYLEENVFLY